MLVAHIYGEYPGERAVRTWMGYIAAKRWLAWRGIRRDHGGGVPENPHEIFLADRVENGRARALPDNVDDQVRGSGHADCGAAFPEYLGKIFSRQRAVKIARGERDVGWVATPALVLEAASDVRAYFLERVRVIQTQQQLGPTSRSGPLRHEAPFDGGARSGVRVLINRHVHTARTRFVDKT